MQVWWNALAVLGQVLDVEALARERREQLVVRVADRRDRDPEREGHVAPAHGAGLGLDREHGPRADPERLGHRRGGLLDVVHDETGVVQGSRFCDSHWSLLWLGVRQVTERSDVCAG